MCDQLDTRNADSVANLAEGSAGDPRRAVDANDAVAQHFSETSVGGEGGARLRAYVSWCVCVCRGAASRFVAVALTGARLLPRCGLCSPPPHRRCASLCRALGHDFVQYLCAWYLQQGSSRKPGRTRYLARLLVHTSPAFASVVPDLLVRPPPARCPPR